jgi:hypothetical protein
VNSTGNPAAVGSIVSLYATGEGQTSPSGVDGTYAGGASGEIAGVLQVNVQIPGGVTTGSAVPILVNIGGTNSQTGVTIAIH